MKRQAMSLLVILMLKVRAIKKLFGYGLAIAFIAIPVVLFWQRQAILDWWHLRGYTAPAAVTELAAQDTMTPSATRIFYVNHPQIIAQPTAFRRECKSAEQTIVLGCYHGDQRGIFVYNVKDKRLAGVEQVTAAHEMLHAAYDRLDTGEREKLDTMLSNFYRNEVKDQRLVDTINSYKKTEPNDVVNEMHSIFGTEIASLPAELEEYYKQYFTDRAAVVRFSLKYKTEFTGRIDQIEKDDAKLKALKAQIDQEETSLNLQLYDLEASRVKLDSLRSTGQITAYNAAVPGYNAKVNAYNGNVGKLERDIKTYNELVAARNAVAGELRELDSALNTSLQKQPSQ